MSKLRMPSCFSRDDGDIGRRRAVAMVILAVVECVLFGFVLDGWPAIAYILKADGVYSSACVQPAYNRSLLRNTSIGRHGYPTCPEQDSILNTAYSVSNVIGQGSAIFMGFMFDRYGLRVSRIVSSCCFVPGVLMLAFQDLALSWLIFPGTILLSLSNKLVIFTVVHVALVMRGHEATFVAVISAAIDVSGFVPAVMQLAYDAGVSRVVCLYAYAGLWSIHILNTIFLSPAYKVPSKSEEPIHQSTEGEVVQDQVSEKNCAPPDDGARFSQYVCQPLYIIHIYYFCVLQLRFWFQIGSFNSWLVMLTGNNTQQVSHLTLVFEYIHLIAIAIAPLIGIVTDRQARIADAEDKDDSPLLDGKDTVTQTMRRAKPMIPALLITITSGVGLSVATLFWTTSAAYVISVFTVFLKATMYASCITFAQLVYPVRHHGKAFGLSVTIACCVDLLEVPMYTWAQKQNPPFELAHVVLLVLCLSALAHPLYIWVSNYRLQRLKAAHRNGYVPFS